MAMKPAGGAAPASSNSVPTPARSPPSPSPDDGLQGEVLVIVGLTLFCNFFASAACIPVLPNLLSDHFSPLAIGIVFAAKPAVQFFANPVVGPLVDRHGPLSPLLLGVLFLCFSVVLLAVGVSTPHMSSAYATLLVAKVCQGLASAATTTAAMTLVAVTHHDSCRGEAMGRAMLGVAAGSLTGPLLGAAAAGSSVGAWAVFAAAAVLLLADVALQCLWLHGVDGWGALVAVLEGVDATVGVCCGVRAAQGEAQGAAPGDGEGVTERLLVSRNAESGRDNAHLHLHPHQRNHGHGHGAHTVQFISEEEQLELRRKSSEPLSVPQLGGSGAGGSGSHAEGRQEQGQDQDQDQEHAVLRLLQDPHVRLLVLVAVAANSCTGMIGPLLPLYLKDEFDTPIMEQGAVLSCITAAYLLSTPVAGRLADQLPRKWVLCCGVAAVGLGLCLFVLSAAGAGAGAGTGLTVVCVALLVTGVGMSFVDTPTLPFLSMLVAAQPALGGTMGSVYALNDMGYCVGFTLGPLLGAALEEAWGRSDDGRSFRLTALCAGLLTLAVLPAAWLTLPEGKAAPASASAAGGGAAAAVPVAAAEGGAWAWDAVGALDGEDDESAFGGAEAGRGTIRDWDRDAFVGAAGAGAVAIGSGGDRSGSRASTGSDPRAGSVGRSVATPPMLTRHHLQQWRQLHPGTAGEQGQELPASFGSRDGVLASSQCNEGDEDEDDDAVL